MRALQRILAIIIGYFFALVGFHAAFALLFGLAAWLHPEPGYWAVAGISPVLFATAPLVAAFAFAAAMVLSVVPTLIMAMLAEWFAWRSPWFYVAPAALLTGLVYLTYSPRTIFGLDGIAVIELALFALSGAVAGLVFWAIAGRKAGIRG